MSSYTLSSLLFETTNDYQKNLETLILHVNSLPQNSLVVAGEVCLTGFDYDNFDAVTEFASYASEKIQEISQDKIIILTLIEEISGEVFNMVKVFHNGEIVYQRAKAKLFRFGGEHNYFSEGVSEDVSIIKVDGLKIGLLICFELRFKALWQQLEGADIIAVPSWWGVLRSEHFKTLTNALAVLNQCYVVASDSLNEECTKLSGIITPQGVDTRNGNRACLELPYNKKEIQLMRRYMDVGIS